MLFWEWGYLLPFICIHMCMYLHTHTCTKCIHVHIYKNKIETQRFLFSYLNVRNESPRWIYLTEEIHQNSIVTPNRFAKRQYVTWRAIRKYFYLLFDYHTYIQCTLIISSLHSSWTPANLHIHPLFYSSTFMFLPHPGRGGSSWAPPPPHRDYWLAWSSSGSHSCCRPMSVMALWQPGDRR